MGLLDKLKNVFFEEEYVEVDEPVKKEKAKEKVTVAKKIETPEIKRVREEIVKKEPPIETQVDESTKEFEKDESEFRFPMNFDDNDFRVEDKPMLVEKEEPVVEVVSHTYSEKETFEESIIDYHSGNYQGLYEGIEKKDRRSGFSPSPIISPIYGVLDKNYKKEEIVTKKEIRLSASSKKVDLDYVREKAYGDLATDITESIHEVVKNKEMEENSPLSDDALLYDLNEDDASPAVKVVTVGDAEEYFNDLGLEYNVDYKVEREQKKEEEVKPVSRRTERKRNVDLEDEIIGHEEENNKDSSDSENNDSNLFDLIDSMYEDKE